MTPDMTELTQLATQVAQRPLTSAECDELTPHLGGLAHTLGMRVSAIERGRTQLTLTIDQRHLQPAGLVNGGVYASLAETTGSLAGIIALGVPVVGVNNNTDFFRPSHTGDLTATATPLALGRRTQVWRITIHNGDTLCACSTLRTMTAS